MKGGIHTFSIQICTERKIAQPLPSDLHRPPIGVEPTPFFTKAPFNFPYSITKDWILSFLREHPLIPYKPVNPGSGILQFVRDRRSLSSRQLFALKDMAKKNARFPEFE